MKDERMTAHFTAMVTCLIWGTTFIASKVLLQKFSVLDVLFYRFLIGYIALTIVKPKPYRFTSIKEEFWLLCEGLSGITVYFLFENMALTYTKTSNVGVIVSVAPMFTVLLAFIFLKEEKPKPLLYLGFVVAMSGIILISFTGGEGFILSPLGDFLAFLAALVWAVYTVIMRKHVHMEGNTIAVTKRIMFYGLLTMTPLTLMYGFPVKPIELCKLEWAPELFFLGLFASALCYLSWNWSLNQLGAVRCSTYIYMIPVVTITASAVILKEVITIPIAVGAALTIAGLIISEKK